jgi:septum formation protein
MKPLILASGSPRRAKILRDLGVEFEIVKTEAPEVSIPHDPVRTVTENACAKLHAALAAPVGLAGRAILAADTIVWFNNRIYGKPRNLDEAKEFLRELSGQTHVVFTGVAFHAEDGTEQTVCVESRVTFRALSNGMIDDYVARVHPTDRAGAYDIDESGDLIVASYTGSYENIMGLPVEPLCDFGIVLPFAGRT